MGHRSSSYRNGPTDRPTDRPKASVRTTTGKLFSPQTTLSLERGRERSAIHSSHTALPPRINSVKIYVCICSLPPSVRPSFLSLRWTVKIVLLPSFCTSCRRMSSVCLLQRIFLLSLSLPGQRERETLPSVLEDGQQHLPVSPPSPLTAPNCPGENRISSALSFLPPFSAAPDIVSLGGNVLQTTTLLCVRQEWSFWSHSGVISSRPFLQLTAICIIREGGESE